MSRVYVTGLGAVSPAGWGVSALCESLSRREQLPTSTVERPGWNTRLRMRNVPEPGERPGFMKHPRLRRTSPITHYAVAAALEAAAHLRANGNSHAVPAHSTNGNGNGSHSAGLGLIVCLQAGCVKYSRNFFAEALREPATASPMLFPETVYAGPASHVAALFGNVSLTYTLVGDPGCFLQGVSLGAQWLVEHRVDACIVVGAEESDWILADALWHLDRTAVLTCGAGALCLDAEPGERAVELAAITDPQTYSGDRDRRLRAARKMRAQLNGAVSAELLCDGIGNNPRFDAAENAAWQDWAGERLSPKRFLGEGLMAGAAWQCVAACEAIMNRGFGAARVSIVGSNQQAIGARFVRFA